MPTRMRAATDLSEVTCSIARSLGIVSDTWSFLLLREAFLGRRTFAEFRDALGIATDVLSVRLARLVEHGVLERTPYQRPGERTRDAYTLTPAGEELKVVLIALQEWGEKNIPTSGSASPAPVAGNPGRRVRIALVDDDGRRVDMAEARFEKAVDGSR